MQNPSFHFAVLITDCEIKCTDKKKKGKMCAQSSVTSIPVPVVYETLHAKRWKCVFTAVQVIYVLRLQSYCFVGPLIMLYYHLLSV